MWGLAQVKNRWVGKTIVDLFAEEFKGRPYDYYVMLCSSSSYVLNLNALSFWETVGNLMLEFQPCIRNSSPI
jgi:hypothetical protein